MRCRLVVKCDSVPAMTLIVLTVLFFGAPAPAAERPHLIHIDLGWVGIGDLGCYGGPAETPHLDALAASGVRFSRCTVSNTSGFSEIETFSGHRAWDLRWQLHPQAPAPLHLAFPQELFKQAGYKTCFQVCNQDLFETGNWTLASKVLDARLKTNSQDLLLAEELIESLKSWDGAKPLYIAWTPGLHRDWDSKSMRTMRNNNPKNENPWPKREVVESVRQRLGDMPPGDIAAAIRKRQAELGLYPEDESWTNPVEDVVLYSPSSKSKEGPPKGRHMNPEEYVDYIASIENLDREVGALIEHLRERDAYEHSLFIVSASDGARGDLRRHGPWAQLSATPFGDALDEHRVGRRLVPLIIARPGTRNGRIEHTPVSTLDVAPTLLAAANVSYPSINDQGHALRPLPGRNLLPAFSGPLPTSDRVLAFGYRGDMRVVYHNCWTAWAPLTLDASSREGWRLFAIDGDALEQTDVAAEHPEIVKQLTTQWIAWGQRHAFLNPWLHTGQ